MNREGKNKQQIAEHFGITKQQLTYRCRLLGIKFIAGIRKGCTLNLSEETKRIKRERMSGERNPFYGKQHSEETKKKFRKKKPWLRGDNNPFKRKIDSSEEERAAHKQRCKNIWSKRDAEWRKAFSEKLSKINAGRPQTSKNSYVQGFHYSNRCPDGFYYRSSWELIFAEHLDESNLIESYECEKLTIPYYDETTGFNRWCRIDFFVKFKNGRKCIVEIKPRSLQERVFWKLQGQCEYCILNDIQWILVDQLILVREFRDFILKECYDGRFTLEKLDRPELVNASEICQEIQREWEQSIKAA